MGDLFFLGAGYTHGSLEPYLGRGLGPSFQEQAYTTVAGSNRRSTHPGQAALQRLETLVAFLIKLFDKGRGSHQQACRLMAKMVEAIG